MSKSRLTSKVYHFDVSLTVLTPGLGIKQRTVDDPLLICDQ